MSPSAPNWQQQTILMLKEQNRLLTQVGGGWGRGAGRGWRRDAVRGASRGWGALARP